MVGAGGMTAAGGARASTVQPAGTIAIVELNKNAGQANLGNATRARLAVK